MARNVTRSVQVNGERPGVAGFLPISISFVAFMIMDALLSIIVRLPKHFLGLPSTRLADIIRKSRCGFQMIKGMTCDQQELEA